MARTEPQRKKERAAMTSVTRSQVPIHLGLDGSKNTISVGMLEPRADTAVVSRNAADDDAMRRLMNKFPDRSRLRVCYEAGPTGFRLARTLACWGIDCEVIAPPGCRASPGIGSRPTAGVRPARPACIGPRCQWSARPGG
jgi:hypothetical protein